jgi:hypothetical protein
MRAAGWLAFELSNLGANLNQWARRANEAAKPQSLTDSVIFFV